MKNSHAEIYIGAMQRLYPTIFSMRDRCLDHLLNTSNEIWYKGKLKPSYSWKLKEFKDMIKSVKNGTALSVEDSLWNRFLENAKEEWYKINKTLTNIDVSCEIEYLAKRYASMNQETNDIPCQYRLDDSYFVTRSYPIFCVPDDITPDWLCVVVEYLDNVINCKVDFDKDSILSKSSRKYFELKEIEKIENNADKMLENAIINILKEEGKEYVPLTKEQEEKRQREWELFYSPTARANSANQNNIKSRESAKNIKYSLILRGIIK